MSTLPIFIQILIYHIINLLFLVPLSTFIHEMGHALVALILTEDAILIQSGRKGPKLKIRIGRVTIILHLSLGSWWAVYAAVGTDKELIFHENIWISISGPVMSLLFAIISLIINALIGWHILLKLLTIDFMVAALLTGIPMRYPKWTGIMAGVQNDALQVLTIIKKNKQHMV